MPSQETEEARRARLLARANSLPLSPGVYIMRGKDEKVIYVGKSRKLRNRVSQYFQNGEKNIKTARMVASVYAFDYILCHTEIEALSLENSLIKQHTPKYNIRLKDAKSYPYIKITAGDYPRLIMTRKREQDKGRYFGPYSGVSVVFSVIRALNKTFRLPSCAHHFPKDIGKVRPCLYYQIGRCCGVCTGKVSPEEYAARIRTVSEVLAGHTAQARRRIEEEMLACAENERFEAAARLRDTLFAMDKLSEKQQVVASPDTEQDVVGLYSDDAVTCISMLYIRDGAVRDKEDFTFGGDSIPDGEGLVSFLFEHYRQREFIPRVVLLSFELPEEDRETLAQVLSFQAERHITVKTPERGGLRTLCETVQANAAEKAKQVRAETTHSEETLGRLASLLGLEVFPTRIESYDISNFGSEFLTAGMVVAENGKMKKSDYRTFRIRSVVGTDDYASMQEVLSRRLDHLHDAGGSFSVMPDLLLLDGGKGHVAAVKEVLSAKGLEIPVFGMVKDDYHKTRALCNERDEINVAQERDIYRFLYQLQEEVHRYTITRMGNAKRKTLKHSSLEGISGIGPVKAKKLLTAFGGIGKLKNATIAEIALTPGVMQKDAAAVYAYYHPVKKDENRETEENET